MKEQYMEKGNKYKVVVEKFSARTTAVWGEGFYIKQKTLERVWADLV